MENLIEERNEILKKLSKVDNQIKKHCTNKDIDVFKRVEFLGKVLESEHKKCYVAGIDGEVGLDSEGVQGMDDFLVVSNPHLDSREMMEDFLQKTNKFIIKD